MTGKQCIYSEQHEHGYNTYSNKEKEVKKREISVFVARPFRDNVSTCHTWSLKPYFEDQIKKYYQKIDENEGKENYIYNVEINDAADMTRIGAITCEKICRPIQKSDCVIVDVSLPNPNVMYELGLALGLGKDIILVANKYQLPNHEMYTEQLREYIDNDKRVLRYPGAGSLTGDIDRDDGVYIITNTLEDSPIGLHFISLSIIEDDNLDQGKNSSNQDIVLPFHNIVEGSIGFAIQKAAENDKTVGKILDEKGLIKIEKNQEIEDNKESTINSNNPYNKCIVNKKAFGKTESDTNYTIQLNNLTNNFHSLSKEVDKAFCCIIDLAGESPLSYLWLGYCHARGINAIPIYREINYKAFNEENRGELIVPTINSSESKITENRVLAFDIRALWYIDYKDIEPNTLASLLSDVFSELIQRDLPRLERDRFWNRLAHSGKIHIFTGAIHIDKLQREMVGDWDQRTVAELVRYLASTDSTILPELNPPVNPPRDEDISSSHDKGGKSLKKKYYENVEKLLKEKDCIIVASADVNALTEILLAHAYLEDSGQWEDMNEVIFPSKPVKEKIDQLHTVIALKNVSDDDNPRQFSRGYIEDEILNKDELLEKDFRGFSIGGSDIVQQPYRSQEDSKDGKGFNLLSHFLLMQNPFPESENNFIVILNGVSGPGTCALAEILTGGNNPEKKIKSEEMLKKINNEFFEISEDKSRCVQGIVKVCISSDTESDSKTESHIFDQREVYDWEWCQATPRKAKKDYDIVKQDYNPWDFGNYKKENIKL